MEHGTQILYKLGHEVGGDTTFSYKAHSLLMHAFYTVSHDGKDPWLYDNLGIDIVQNDTVMHVPEDQAFF